MSHKQKSPLPIQEGGTNNQGPYTEFAVITAGTTATGALQTVASLGTSGQVLTSTGTSSLPTFQDAPAGDSNVVFEPVAGDPPTPADADVWFDTVANSFQGRANSTTITFNVT